MEKNIRISAVVGIDPGSNGGIVTWRPNQNIKAIQMPKDLTDLRNYLEYLKTICSPIVFLEKLSVRPDDVTPGADGVNMGKLYRIQKMMANFEQLKAIKDDTKKRRKERAKTQKQRGCREFVPGIETDIVERRRHVDNALWTIHFAQQPRLGASESTKQHARTFVLAT